MCATVSIVSSPKQQEVCISSAQVLHTCMCQNALCAHSGFPHVSITKPLRNAYVPGRPRTLGIKVALELVKGNNYFFAVTRL